MYCTRAAQNTNFRLLNSIPVHWTHNGQILGHHCRPYLPTVDHVIPWSFETSALDQSKLFDLVFYSFSLFCCLCSRSLLLYISPFSSKSFCSFSFCVVSRIPSLVFSHREQSWLSFPITSRYGTQNQSLDFALSITLTPTNGTDEVGGEIVAACHCHAFCC